MRRVLPLVWIMACNRTAHPTSTPPAEHAHHGGHGGHPHHMDAMPHRFEDAEAWAKRFDDPTRDTWQKPDVVVASLELAATDVVADVGAGTGYFAMRLAKAVPQGKVLASDVEPDMVRYLGERAKRDALTNVVPILGVADDPKLTEPANLVLMCNVAHHVADRVAFFTHVREQLATGGRVVIIDFEPDAPEDAPGPPKAMRIAAKALAAELGQAGLVLAAEDHDQLPYQYVLQFRAR